MEKNFNWVLDQVSGLGSLQPRSQALSTLSGYLCCFDAGSYPTEFSLSWTRV